MQLRGARRLTLRPPGRMPSRSQPRFTHASIALQIASTRARISASGASAFSFSSISVEIAMPCSRARRSSSSPELNGYGT